MAAETLCVYPGRDEALISYLYDDLTGPERSAFDTHLVLCVRCRTEIAQLRGVREELEDWTVVSRQPSVVSLGRQSGSLGHQSDSLSLQPAAPARRAWWREVPAWAQVAAALLCLGVGAGLANLDVRYDRQGLSIRTGWLKSSPAGQDSSVVGRDAKAVVEQDFNPASQTVVGQAFSPAEKSAPWRADLAALERELRTEFRSAGTPTPTVVSLARSTTPAMSEAELLKRVRALVEESERKQNRELALRVGEMVKDINAQRQADLRKIDQSLGLIQSNTGVEVLKQRQLLNYLVRVSSQK